MKWDELFSLRISELVSKQLAQTDQIELQDQEESIREKIYQLIQLNFDDHKKLEEEIYQMMDDLEKQGHQFERHKMYPALKQQLAKKKGIIL